jgi:hypothetical protein
MHTRAMVRAKDDADGDAVLEHLADYWVFCVSI